MWKFEVFKDPDRGWCWRLVQRNTLIVFESSTSFERRADAQQSAEEARRWIGTAEVKIL